MTWQTGSGCITEPGCRHAVILGADPSRTRARPVDGIGEVLYAELLGLIGLYAKMPRRSTSPVLLGAAPDQERRVLRLMAAILLSALLLQRFGLTVGASYLSFVGPIGLALAGYGLVSGIFAIHRGRMILFAAMVGWMFAGIAVHAALPDAYGAPMSWTSLIQFAAITFFGIAIVSHTIDETRFFRMINAILFSIALAGLAEFALQFAGLKLFSFSTFVPANLLLEGPYNTVIPIGDSGYLKSNGMFLVEPSVFSQFMALAIIIEMLILRRRLHLSVYAVALLSSFSGTGWLMIAIFVLTAALSLGSRGLLISLTTVLVVVFMLGLLALVFPTGFDFFLSRTSEVYDMGSSGHLRFVTPWWLFGYVLSRTPWTWLYGLGAGVSEHLAMRPAWDYNLNPPVKITLEYGLPCFVMYVLFLLTGRKTSSQKALLAPIFVLLLLDGGYSQFPPVLFPSMLLIMTADLRPGLQPRVASPLPIRTALPARGGSNG